MKQIQKKTKNKKQKQTANEIPKVLVVALSGSLYWLTVIKR